MTKAYNIDQYQQRIKIDVLYKHPDNRRIIDEYKDILVSHYKKKRHGSGKGGAAQQAAVFEHKK